MGLGEPYAQAYRQAYPSVNGKTADQQETVRKLCLDRHMTKRTWHSVGNIIRCDLAPETVASTASSRIRVLDSQQALQQELISSEHLSQWLCARKCWPKRKCYLEADRRA